MKWTSRASITCMASSVSRCRYCFSAQTRSEWKSRAARSTLPTHFPNVAAPDAEARRRVATMRYCERRGPRGSTLPAHPHKRDLAFVDRTEEEDFQSQARSSTAATARPYGSGAHCFFIHARPFAISRSFSAQSSVIAFERASARHSGVCSL